MHVILNEPAVYVQPNGDDDALGLVLILTSTVGAFQLGPEWVIDDLYTESP